MKAGETFTELAPYRVEGLDAQCWGTSTGDGRRWRRCNSPAHYVFEGQELCGYHLRKLFAAILRGLA